MKMYNPRVGVKISNTVHDLAGADTMMKLSTRSRSPRVEEARVKIAEVLAVIFVAILVLAIASMGGTVERGRHASASGRLSVLACYGRPLTPTSSQTLHWKSILVMRVLNGRSRVWSFGGLLCLFVQ